MKGLISYLSERETSTRRSYIEKYYDEMQMLAYNLVKYLSMNDDPNESNKHQGNHNMTYLEENMSRKDFLMVASMFLRRIPVYEVKDMIETWCPSSKEFSLADYNKKYNDLMTEYSRLQRQYDDLKESLRELAE